MSVSTGTPRSKASFCNRKMEEPPYRMMRCPSESCATKKDGKPNCPSKQFLGSTYHGRSFEKMRKVFSGCESWPRFRTFGEGWALAVLCEWELRRNNSSRYSSAWFNLDAS